MIDDLPASERPARELVAREVLAFVAAGVLYPFGMARARPRPTARQREQRTIVLVHGYLANRSTLLPLRAYLRAHGEKSVRSFDYRSSDGVERSARALKEFLSRTVRGGRIDLVCHSLGGVVARCYLQELGGARRVDRCITLSTPHRGTYGSYWVASRVGREMRPDSALMRRLEATRSAAARVQFTSIVAGSDNIVFPRIFAAHERLVHIPDIGHVGMLFSPRVLQTVAETLRAPLS
jgi:pimeloyl-ACP methyl ester carboxylesterase